MEKTTPQASMEAKEGGGGGGGGGEGRLNCPCLPPFLLGIPIMWLQTQKAGMTNISI